MLRKLAIGIVAVVGALVALLAVAFAAAQTPPAKDKIADVVAGKLGGPQRQAEVQGLGGLLPFDIRVGRFALRDDKGVWLEVDKARVKLSPADLLKGDIHVEDAGAERVAVDHLPPPGPPAPPSGEPFKLPQLPQLPESLPKVQVDRLHLDSVELHRRRWGRRPPSAWRARAAPARTASGRPSSWRCAGPTSRPPRSTSTPTSTSRPATSASTSRAARPAA